MGTPKRVIILIAVLALAALVRLALVPEHRCQPERITSVDSAAYLELAQSLLRDGGFAAQNGRPETFRTPGYPLLLAALGARPATGHGRVIALQIALGVALVGLCWLGFARRIGAGATLAACFILAIDVPHVVYANMIMSDIPCAFAVALAWWLATRRGTAMGALAAGATLSFATALRPICGLLWLPLAVALWSGGHRAGKARSGKIAVVIAVVIASLAFPVAWAVRNGLVANNWSLSTAFDVNLLLVAAPKVEARATGTTRAQAHARLSRVTDSDQQENPSVSRHQLGRRVALAAILAHPGAAITELGLSGGEMLLAGERRNLLRLQGLGNPEATSVGEGRRSISGVGRSLVSIGGGQQALVAIQLVVNGLLWLLAASGAVLLWRGGQRQLLAELLLALAVVLVPSLVVGTARMRIPVALFAAVLAGIGLVGLARLGRGSAKAE